MVTIQEAITKAISIRGAEVLSKKEELCVILEDLAPELIKERNFIETFYDNELGQIFQKAYQSSLDIRILDLLEADLYLSEEKGLVPKKRKELIEIFKQPLNEKIAVKRFKDYKPALMQLREEYRGSVPKEVVRYFVEENKLFSRFSMTLDDVISDLRQAGR